MEQRIGRIDRLGQRHPVVRISNLHYEDTVETDVYRALGSRINLFQMIVGPLQPILARLPGTITNTVLADPRTEAPDRAGLREAIERQIDEGESGGFDIDAVLEEEWTRPERPAPAMTMDDLDRIIGAEALMPQGTQVRPLGAREYALRAPGMTSELRVTTDPDYYEEHTKASSSGRPGTRCSMLRRTCMRRAKRRGRKTWRSCSTEAQGKPTPNLASPTSKFGLWRRPGGSEFRCGLVTASLDGARLFCLRLSRVAPGRINTVR